jgi:hypothetical protein
MKCMRGKSANSCMTCVQDLLVVAPADGRQVRCVVAPTLRSQLDVMCMQVGETVADGYLALMVVAAEDPGPPGPGSWIMAIPFSVHESEESGHGDPDWDSGPDPDESCRLRISVGRLSNEAPEANRNLGFQVCKRLPLLHG